MYLYIYMYVYINVYPPTPAASRGRVRGGLTSNKGPKEKSGAGS